MPRPLTIALCCNTAFAIANFRAGVIKSLISAGHRVAVVAPDDAVYMAVLKAMGAECIPWSLSGRSTQPLHELAAVNELTTIYRRLRPDLAFHYTIKSVIYGAIASRRTGVPCVSVITGLGYVFLNSGWVSRIARALYARTLRWSKEVWFLNAEDEDTFRRLRLIEGLCVRRLPGEGVDMSHFAEPARTAGSGASRVFLMIARLLRDKGVVEYVEAARIVRKAYPSARFQLLGAAGDDNPTAISRKQVDAWVTEGVVEYLGTVRDVRPSITEADCVVLPSYREGAPRSLLEAASMSRPLVATDVPGCRDVVLPSSGMLCKPRNARDLADKLLAIAKLSDDALAAMGQHGRKHVAERFDERAVVDVYHATLARLRRAQ
jgi:glycosyltransferase involved in cell wall biosynthesis